MTIAKYIFLALFSMTIFFGIAEASDSEEERQRHFVQHLLRSKEYFRAITEAERYVFYYPNSGYVEDMKILIADAYARGGDEVAAFERYNAFLNEYPNSSRVPLVYFRIGKLLADNREYQSAKEYFQRILEHKESSESISRKAKEWILLCLLLSDSSDEVIGRTIDEFNLANLPDVKDLVDEYDSLNFKSPSTAGTLSAIIPGAGQLYLGRKRDAAAAFILNGLFIWGIVAAIENDEHAVAAILAVFEFGWYAGNIYSAVNGTHKHNRKLRDSYKIKFTIGLNLRVTQRNEAVPTFNISYSF